MAQKVVIELVDDISGDVLKEGAGETVRFSLDGTEYEIDLASKSATAMRKALKPYTDKAARVGKASGKRGKRTPVASDTKAIRVWAEANKVELSTRGRIPESVRQQYEEAQK